MNLKIHVIILLILLFARLGVSTRSSKLSYHSTGGGGVLPYKGLMGTCGQSGYVFRDFCLKKGIDFITFCLSQGIDLINFCLKQGTFSWTINSLRVCSTNVLNSVTNIGILS